MSFVLAHSVYLVISIPFSLSPDDSVRTVNFQCSIACGNVCSDQDYLINYSPFAWYSGLNFATFISSCFLSLFKTRNHWQNNEKIKHCGDRRPKRNNKDKLKLKGRQPSPCRRRTCFTMLRPSPSRKLYEISGSQIALAMLCQCVRFNFEVQWLHSCTIFEFWPMCILGAWAPELTQCTKQP